jgi:hypothetical protein
MLLATGFDEALLGVGQRCGQPDVAVYDIDLMVKVLTEGGMTEEDAWEHLDFNVLGGWVGEETPVFVRRATVEQVRAEADCPDQLTLPL